MRLHEQWCTYYKTVCLFSVCSKSILYLCINFFTWIVLNTKNPFWTNTLEYYMWVLSVPICCLYAELWFFLPLPRPTSVDQLLSYIYIYIPWRLFFFHCGGISYPIFVSTGSPCQSNWSSKLYSFHYWFLFSLSWRRWLNWMECEVDGKQCNFFFFSEPWELIPFHKIGHVLI